MIPKPGFVAIATATSLCFSDSACADQTTESPDFLNAIFDAATLYKNDANPYIQRLDFTGRAQFDFVHIEGEGMRRGQTRDQDLHFDDFNIRRLRAGLKAKIFHNFQLQIEADLQPEEDPWYQRLTDASIGWKYSDAFNLKIGKQSIGFTLDGTTSTKELLTIDRNNLSNNLWMTNEYLPGVTIGGQHGNWVYQTGIFSQGAADQEFGEFDAGIAALASIGYNFAESFDAEKALLTLDYAFNEATVSTDPLFTNRTLTHISSLNFRYKKEQFGFQADLSGAKGYAGQPSLRGISLMPSYDFSDKIQGVLRGTLVDSSGDNGVRFAGYESDLLGGAKGDRYQELYAGLNYYIHGHNLKLQTGLSYIEMEDDANDGGDFSGFSFQTGLRISW